MFHRKLPDIRSRRAAVRRFADVKPTAERYTICRPGKRSAGSDLSNGDSLELAPANFSLPAS